LQRTFHQVIFKLLSVFNKLRVDDATISGFGGLDKAEHGEYGYVLTPHRDGTVVEPPKADRQFPTPSGSLHSGDKSKVHPVFSESGF
jgi:hypothetical protein